MMSMSILIYLVRLLPPSSSSGSSPSTNTGISKSWHISGRSLTASQLALVECSPKGPNPVTTRVISQRKMLPQTLQSVKSLQLLRKSAMIFLCRENISRSEWSQAPLAAGLHLRTDLRLRVQDPVGTWAEHCPLANEISLSLSLSLTITAVWMTSGQITMTPLWFIGKDLCNNVQLCVSNPFTYNCANYFSDELQNYLFANCWLEVAGPRFRFRVRGCPYIT